MIKLQVQYFRLTVWIIATLTVLHSFGQTEKQGLPFDFEKDPVHLNFSTKESEIGPAVVGKNLWFTVNKIPEVKTPKGKKSKKKFYNLVKVEIGEDGNPKQGITSVPGLEMNCHVGPVSFCEKTGELYITTSNVDSPDIKNKVFRKKKVNLGIVVAKENNGRWKITGKFPFDNPSYSIAHPAISKTGDTLFFISDNPQTSKGGTDIYMSVRKDNIWGKPVNIGDIINSTGNETSPFYSPDGILFFSSDRIEGFGGFDIYYSNRRKNAFSVPVDLGPEINSVYDDFGFVIDRDHNNGYFVSNRPDFTGSDDLFQIPIKQTSVLSRIVEKASGRPVKNALVRLTKDGKILKEIKPSERGDFSFEIPNPQGLALVIEARNYLAQEFEDILDIPPVVELEKEIPPEERAFNFINQNNVGQKVDTVGKEPVKQVPLAEKQEIKGSQILFSVQVGAFQKPLPRTYSGFKNISGLQVKKSGDLYIYFIALCGHYSEAQKEKERLIKSFPDCFIIAFEGENKIAIKEALKKTKE